MVKSKLIYTGKGKQPKPPYLPSAELVDAVNLTIFLQKRPLLLKGEPGCGKTKLAEAVATELGLIDNKNKEDNHFFFWSIKSTTRAKDGLYTFDAVRRLQDAQLAIHDPELRRKVETPGAYITLGPLGKALSCSTKERPSIILIDEIDKADIDFPNDLLLELDEQRFEISEETDASKRWIQAQYPPIVFITSNDEKDLPDAFLRRCLFYYIDFPSHQQLYEIIKQHCKTTPQLLIEKAVNAFTALRVKMGDQASKKVSTSELIDWVKILSRDEKVAIEQLDQGRLPYREATLKSRVDQETFAPRKI